MIFTARIRRSSPVWRHWIEQHLRRASLCAVPFIRTDNNDFVFDGSALDTGQIALMRSNPCVVLEVRGGPDLRVVENSTPAEPIVQETIRVGALTNMRPETVEALGEVAQTVARTVIDPIAERALRRHERRRHGR